VNLAAIKDLEHVVAQQLVAHMPSEQAAVVSMRECQVRPPVS
jgi:hypothetical protein